MTDKNNEPLGSPLAVKILLHCHTEHTPTPAGSRTHEDIIERLILDRIIEYGGASDCGGIIHKTTTLGKAWVVALYQLPPPRRVEVFVDSEGREIGRVEA